MSEYPVEFNSEFFDHYTSDASVTDAYALMGYAGEHSAVPRYLEVKKYIEDNIESITNILDIGSGLGMMWFYFNQIGFLQTLRDRGISITALEPYQVYYMRSKDGLADLDINILDEGIESYADLPHKAKFDLVVSVGAFNYYEGDAMHNFFTLMDKMSTNHLLLETNIMTGRTPWSPGNFNPSMEMMYTMFSRVTKNFTMKIIRKYTSFWSYSKH